MVCQEPHYFLESIQRPHLDSPEHGDFRRNDGKCKFSPGIRNWVRGYLGCLKFQQLIKRWRIAGRQALVARSIVLSCGKGLETWLLGLSVLLGPLRLEVLQIRVERKL